MRVSGLKIYSKDSLVSQLHLWVYLGTLMLFFMSQTPTSFYYAGTPDVSNNVWHFYDDARCLAQGNLPYSDNFTHCVAAARKVPPQKAAFEYPPLAAVFIGALGLAAKEKGTFQLLFTGAALGMFAVCFMMIFGEAERLRKAGGKDLRIAITAAAIICSLSAGPVAMVSFDLLPAALALAAFISLNRNRMTASTIFLALSVAAKGYAVILLPLFIFEWLRNGGGKSAAKQLAAFFCAAGAFAAAGFAISPSGFLKSFTYHSGRGLEINSLYAAAIIALRPGGAAPVKSFDHGSWNLEGGGAFLKLWPVFMIALLVIATVAAWRNAKRTDITSSAPGGDRYSAGLRWIIAALAAFIVAFKIGSPQFLCWIAPFAPLLIFESGGLAGIVLFVLAGHAVTTVYPGMWFAYSAGLNQLPATILLFEKVCLLILFVWMLRPMFHRHHYNDSHPIDYVLIDAMIKTTLFNISFLIVGGLAMAFFFWIQWNAAAYIVAFVGAIFRMTIVRHRS